jgi:hypothetical protein
MTLTAAVLAGFCALAAYLFRVSVQLWLLDQSPEKNAELMPWISSSIKRTKVADRAVGTCRGPESP